MTLPNFLFKHPLKGIIHGNRRKDSSYPICDLLDSKYPIVLAGMGEAATPALAAAVSNAGGLGILGASAQDPDGLSEWIQRTRKPTSQPFGVHTLLPTGVPSGGEKKTTPYRDSANAPRFRPLLSRTSWDSATRSKQIAHPVEDDLFSRFLSEATRSHFDEKVLVYSAGLGNPAFLMPKARAHGMKVIAIAGAVKHAHVLEPADLWTTRLDKQGRDDAPRITTIDGREGDFIMIQGFKTRPLAFEGAMVDEKTTLGIRLPSYRRCVALLAPTSRSYLHWYSRGSYAHDRARQCCTGLWI